jgi:hypothetical protein
MYFTRMYTIKMRLLISNYKNVNYRKLYSGEQKKVTHQIQSEVRTMYWIVHAKRHDNDFDVSLFLLAIVHLFIYLKK